MFIGITSTTLYGINILKDDTSNRLFSQQMYGLEHVSDVVYECHARACWTNKNDKSATLRVEMATA